VAANGSPVAGTPDAHRLERENRWDFSASLFYQFFPVLPYSLHMRETATVAFVIDSY